jgi:hypothetical protein
MLQNDLVVSPDIHLLFRREMDSGKFEELSDLPDSLKLCFTNNPQLNIDTSSNDSIAKQILREI